MNVSEFLSDSIPRLREAGIENARLEAEILLSSAMGVAREKLLVRAESSLGEKELSRARGLIQERASRVPLQYLTGVVEFMGLQFAVRRGVFIPRPETEILVLEASKVLKELEAAGGPASAPARDAPKTETSLEAGTRSELNRLPYPHAPRHITHDESHYYPVVLDIGTGCGVIAVSLATLHSRAVVHASDTSATAIEVAAANAAEHGVKDRVLFHLGAMLSAEGMGRLAGSVDVLVSNPPYVPSSDIPALAPEVGKHEPRQAIDGGPDGLDVVRSIFELAPRFVKRRGWCLIEIGQNQAGRALELARSAGFEETRTVKDLAGIERVLVGRRGY